MKKPKRKKKPGPVEVTLRVPPIAVCVKYEATATRGGADGVSYVDSVQRVMFNDKYQAADKLRTLAEFVGSTVDEMGGGEIIITRRRR